MKKPWLLIAIVGGVIAGMLAGLVLPVEWRGKLSRPLAVPIGRCLEYMPDE